MLQKHILVVLQISHHLAVLLALGFGQFLEDQLVDEFLLLVDDNLLENQLLLIPSARSVGHGRERSWLEHFCFSCLLLLQILHQGALLWIEGLLERCGYVLAVEQRVDPGVIRLGLAQTEHQQLGPRQDVVDEIHFESGRSLGLSSSLSRERSKTS